MNVLEQFLDFCNEDMITEIKEASEKRGRVPSHTTVAKLQLLEEISEMAKAHRNNDKFNFFQEMADVCITVVAHTATGFCNLVTARVLCPQTNVDEMLLDMYRLASKSGGGNFVLQKCLLYVNHLGQTEELYDAINKKVKFNMVRDD